MFHIVCMDRVSDPGEDNHLRGTCSSSLCFTLITRKDFIPWIRGKCASLYNIPTIHIDFISWIRQNCSDSTIHQQYTYPTRVAHEIYISPDDQQYIYSKPAWHEIYSQARSNME